MDTTDAMTTETQTAQSGHEDQRLADLIGDALGPSPSTPAAPSPPATTEATPAAVEPPAPAASAKPKTPESRAPETPESKVPEKRWKIRGKEYTLDQLVERGLLDDLVTTHEQFPHLQRKYQEILEKQAPSQAPAAAPAPPQLTPAQIRAAYAPHVSEAVKAGWIESDFAELYPDLAAQMIFHRDLLYDARLALAAIQAQLRDGSRQHVAEQVRGTLDRALDQVASQGDFYAGLKDPAVRQGFLNYLLEVNPPVEQLTPSFLSRQWAAYNHEAVLTTTRQAIEREQAEQKKRVQAKGEGRGSRPTGPTEPPTLLDQLIEDRLPRR